MKGTHILRAFRRLCPGLRRCCRLCGADSAHATLCAGCRSDLPYNRRACPLCAEPLESLGVCPGCLRAPPVFQRCLAPLLYQAPVDTLIHDLKFRGQLAMAPLLAEYLLEALQQRRQALPQCLVPVPLHPRRLARRGFNQALEICRPLGKALRIPILSRCYRRLPGPPQASLPAARRGRNVSRAFQPLRSPDYRHIAIVDDVLTTGSTANALAAALYADGARYVEVWVPARAPSPTHPPRPPRAKASASRRSSA